MKWIIIATIKLYWFLIPSCKRNKCLFNTSCSLIVFNMAVKHNAIIAIKAYLKRRKICRPGYKIIIGKVNGIELINKKFEAYNNLSVTIRNEIIFYKNYLK